MTGWWESLQVRADQPPRVVRDALHVAAGMVAIGSIERELAERMAAAGLPIGAAAEGWCISGAPVNDTFARIAGWLRDQGLASAWRDELLSVADASGTSIGAIERAAVRPLGIATRAVHLIGRAEQGGVWVQQRAFDKSTDPGQWDTLMGGLVSADETIAATLVRETWEEAGLRIDALRDVRACGELTVRRPVSNGYMIEHIQVFEAVIPAGLAPLNQDGEVVAFECLSVEALRDRLRAGAFTLEAALILGDWLARSERERTSTRE
jgi:8-oxo-dGTP pyrophosphatase MutT (NUDIX family)